MLVAYMRALADAGVTHVSGFHDPTARVFLSERGARRVAKIGERNRAGRGGFRLAAVRAAADLMALRTTTIDQAVRAAIARGTTQLVILGAGLDGRAWRMSELAGVSVFEVDHPATQSVKRAKAAGLPPSVARVTFVPIDFERDVLGTALERAGHDATSPTCWIWEGVVMYLTHDAMRATLASVASRSAEGSTLIVNYHTTIRRGLHGLILRLMGEPQRSQWSPDEMAADLRAAGFRVDEDSGMTDWLSRFAPGAPEAPTARVMRVVVASRVRD
jgi:methyltransferase (TIGR00027 family)